MAVDTRYVHECTVFKTQEAPTPSKLVSLTLYSKNKQQKFFTTSWTMIWSFSLSNGPTKSHLLNQFYFVWEPGLPLSPPPLRKNDVNCMASQYY